MSLSSSITPSSVVMKPRHTYCASHSLIWGSSDGKRNMLTVGTYLRGNQSRDLCLSFTYTRTISLDGLLLLTRPNRVGVEYK